MHNIMKLYFCTSIINTYISNDNIEYYMWIASLVVERSVANTL